MELIGKQFGDFYILQELAIGARSHIFICSDGRSIKALKVFLHGSAAFAKKEYKLGHLLNHPNLNPIEEMIEIEGYQALIMPFVSGNHLSRYYDASLSEFIKVFSGLLLAIGYLHDNDIIHRDIKPDNIIVDDKGHATLLDFDLAVRSNLKKQDRTVAGTIAYISPEQAQGSAATKASDLYSAGIILYRAITGEVPFTGNATEVAQAHQREIPRLPSTFHSDLKAFDDIIKNLLAKEQKHRFQKATEVLKALIPLSAYADRKGL